MNRLRSSLMSSGQEKNCFKWLFLVNVCEYPRVLSHISLKHLFHCQSCRVYFTALTYEGLGGDGKWWNRMSRTHYLAHHLPRWKFNWESSVGTASVLFWQKYFSRVEQSTMLWRGSLSWQSEPGATKQGGCWSQKKFPLGAECDFPKD